MRGAGSSDLGFGALRRSIRADAAKIRRRALGKKALRIGGGAMAAFSLGLALMIAIPPFTWPVGGRVTSGFFFRQKPDSAAPLAIEFHKGLDIAAPIGTRVRATAPGIVVETGTAPDLGNYVRVRHLLGLTSTYGHLSRIDVARGSLILFRGLTPIGAAGSTGRSTGAHLHFAISARTLPLPPRLLLTFHTLRRWILGF